jgi:anti-sigma factor RsiW
MSCRHIDEMLPRYLENDLSADDRRGIDEHLASCERCRQSLETFRELEESLGELAASVPSWEAAEAGLARRFGMRPRRPIAAVFISAPFIAGLSFIVLGVALFVRGKLILGAMQPLGPRYSIALDGFTRMISGWFAAVAGVDVTLLLVIYGLLTLGLLYWSSRFVPGFGRG